MSHVTHIYERANTAAAMVDPMELASALDHIAKTAAKSRSQTRRLRWIEMRATYALEGREYRDTDVDLPKSAGPNTPERLFKKLAHEQYLRHEMTSALQAVVDFIEGKPDAPEPFGIVREALAKAATAQPQGAFPPSGGGDGLP